MHLYDDLEQRGLVAQSTSPDVRAALNTQKLTAYIGFDPTAPSLHIGGLLPVTMLMRLQRAGHRPLALVGGGTGLIGDPSGKESERSMLSLDVLEQNVAALRKQLGRFLDFEGDKGAVLLNNADWLATIDLLGFLRDIGRHFSVNAMMARDSVRMRLEAREQGISYTEFSYMLLQAYDYLALYERAGKGPDPGRRRPYSGGHQGLVRPGQDEATPLPSRGAGSQDGEVVGEHVHQGEGEVPIPRRG